MGTEKNKKTRSDKSQVRDYRKRLGNFIIRWRLAGESFRRRKQVKWQQPKSLGKQSLVRGSEEEEEATVKAIAPKEIVKGTGNKD